MLFAAVLTGILIIYQQLGGFEDLSVEKIEPFEYKIAGREYEGKISAKEWEQLFFETKGFLDDRILVGDLVIVWMKQPDEDTEVGKAFVGIDLKGEQELPESLTLKEFSFQGILRTELKGHVLVLPQPEDVIAKLKEFALKEAIKVQDLVIDRYTLEEAVFTEIPY